MERHSRVCTVAENPRRNTLSSFRRAKPSRCSALCSRSHPFCGHRRGTDGHASRSRFVAPRHTSHVQGSITAASARGRSCSRSEVSCRTMVFIALMVGASAASRSRAPNRTWWKAFRSRCSDTGLYSSRPRCSAWSRISASRTRRCTWTKTFSLMCRSMTCRGSGRSIASGSSSASPSTRFHSANGWNR